jgi:hypothetical protein
MMDMRVFPWRILSGAALHRKRALKDRNGRGLPIWKTPHCFMVVNIKDLLF